MTSQGPDFWEKAADVCGLYLNPPEAAVVWSVDEKSGIQARSRVNPTKPPVPGIARRREFEYRRHGTALLYAGLNVHDGGVAGWVTDSTRAANFVEFPVNRNVPAQLDVHVILDNLSAHKTPTVQRWLLRLHRFHLHFTPTYGSWMNLVERWFSALTTKKLQRSAHSSVKELAADINAWAATWNENPHPVRVAQDRRTDP